MIIQRVKKPTLPAPSHPSPILAIDPGCSESAFVVWEPSSETLFDKGILSNNDILSVVLKESFNCSRLVVEMVGHYGTGMPAGKTIFDTCVWIGRFIQIWGDHGYDLVLRKRIVADLCGSAKAKDSNVRQALVDRFGPPGTRKNPGRLYGVKKDIWSALAIAVTWGDANR